jgi:hypothetical protein
MTRHYCTLFDRNYFFKGLALHRSLETHGGDYVLHILCMDDAAHEMLVGMGLPNVRLIRHADFADPALLAVRPQRSVAEYCWTCTASLPLYVLDRNPEIDLITYLDADLYLYSSPEPLFCELGDRSILILEHRFAPRFAHFAESGKFNVEWLTFRRDEDGLGCLRWWREKCIEWCYDRLEDGRYGDQKYLDDWPERFRGVHVLRNIGAGVAPWNFENYRVDARASQVHVDDVPLIFYHFHGFKLTPWGGYVPMPEIYEAVRSADAEIYAPYADGLRESLRRTRMFAPDFAFGIEPWGSALRLGLHRLVHKSYWAVPEWVRHFARRLFPASVRSRVVRLLK